MMVLPVCVLFTIDPTGQRSPRGLESPGETRDVVPAGVDGEPPAFPQERQVCDAGGSPGSNAYGKYPVFVRCGSMLVPCGVLFFSRTEEKQEQGKQGVYIIPTGNF